MTKETKLLREWGRIVPGVNTTRDVDRDFLRKQAEKWGFEVDVDGRPKSKYQDSAKNMK